MAQREAIVPMQGAASAELGGSAAAGWAESPLQLLSIVEAHVAGVLGQATVAVPRMGASWLAATAGALQAMRLPDGLVIAEPRSVLPAPTDIFAVGDAYSGKMQSSLVLRGHNRLVIVDDGLATVDLLRLIASRQALTRARVRKRLLPGAARWVLGRMALGVLRRAAQHGHLEVFTAMAVSDDLVRPLKELGVTLHHHSFSWLRSQSAPPVPDRPTIVLGSSLSHDGLIDSDKYLSWLLDKANTGPIAYFPHRREDKRVLARLQGHHNVLVERSGLPVELSLRGLAAGQRVVSLPSTAAVSLRLMLSDSDATVDVVELPSDWWTSRANQQIQQRLRRTAAGDQ